MFCFRVLHLFPNSAVVFCFGLFTYFRWRVYISTFHLLFLLFSWKLRNYLRNCQIDFLIIISHFQHRYLLPKKFTCLPLNWDLPLCCVGNWCILLICSKYIIINDINTWETMEMGHQRVVNLIGTSMYARSKQRKQNYEKTYI